MHNGTANHGLACASLRSAYATNSAKPPVIKTVGDSSWSSNDTRDHNEASIIEGHVSDLTFFFNPRGLRAWQQAEKHRLALQRQAEEHHRGHGPTAACSRRRTRQATIQPKHPQTTTGNHSTRAAVGAARSREPPDPTEATRSRVCMTKKRRQASPPMCGQEIGINVDRKPLILLS